MVVCTCCFFFSSRRRHTRWPRDWSSDVCSSDLYNYIFYNENDVMFYALGTLGIHYAKVSWDGPSGSEWSGRASGSDTELGLGLGAGVEYNLGSMNLYAEPRLFLSGFEQFSLAAGRRIPIN